MPILSHRPVAASWTHAAGSIRFVRHGSFHGRLHAAHVGALWMGRVTRCPSWVSAVGGESFFNLLGKCQAASGSGHCQRLVRSLDCLIRVAGGGQCGGERIEDGGILAFGQIGSLARESDGFFRIAAGQAGPCRQQPGQVVHCRNATGITTERFAIESHGRFEASFLFAFPSQGGFHPDEAWIDANGDLEVFLGFGPISSVVKGQSEAYECRKQPFLSCRRKPSDEIVCRVEQPSRRELIEQRYHGNTVEWFNPLSGERDGRLSPFFQRQFQVFDIAEQLIDADASFVQGGQAAIAVDQHAGGDGQRQVDVEQVIVHQLQDFDQFGVGAARSEGKLQLIDQLLVLD